MTAINAPALHYPLTLHLAFRLRSFLPKPFLERCQCHQWNEEIAGVPYTVANPWH